MPPRPKTPRSLLKGPFTLDEAERQGLRRWHLEGSSWERIGPQTYVAADQPLTPMIQLEAAARRLPKGAAFSGFTAGWLAGLELPPCDPIEVVVPRAANVSARAGMAVSRAGASGDEIVTVQGLPATSVRRTLRDVCGRLTLTEAVVLCDLALQKRLVSRKELDEVVRRATGSRGIATLRRALAHVEPLSESPMESRLRMLLVLGGLPRPEAQVEIRDRWLRLIGRVDLYYRMQRLALEYDGGTHRNTLAEDNRRQNRLLNQGVRLLRFTAADVYQDADGVLRQVRTALAA